MLKKILIGMAILMLGGCGTGNLQSQPLNEDVEPSVSGSALETNENTDESDIKQTSSDVVKDTDKQQDISKKEIEEVVEQKSLEPNYEKGGSFTQVSVPITVIDSLNELNRILNEANTIVQEIESNASNLHNIHFSQTYHNYQTKLIDLYIESRISVANISYYHFIANQSPTELNEYEYVLLYQDTMRYLMNSVHGLEDISFDSEKYHGAQRRFKEATQIYNELIGMLRSDGTSFDMNKTQITEDSIHPIYALDILWASNLKVRGMIRDRLDQETSFSKLPIEDVMTDLNNVVDGFSPYQGYLLNFDEEHNVLALQRYKEAERANAEDRSPFVINYSDIHASARKWENSIDNMWVVYQTINKHTPKVNMTRDMLDQWTVTSEHDSYLDAYFNSRNLLLEQEREMIRDTNRND